MSSLDFPVADTHKAKAQSAILKGEVDYGARACV